MKYEELKEKYPRFIYRSYDVEESDEEMILRFNFEIEGLASFHPETRIAKKYIINESIDKKFLNDLVFHIGLIEMISYYKATVSKEIIIEAGHLEEKQIEFIKKLIFNGLGEFFHVNGINIDNDFVKITTTGSKVLYDNKSYKGDGNMILVGGGKDSNVSLKLLKGMNNDVMIQNIKDVTLNCALIGGISEKNIVSIKRSIDPELIRLNKEGFLNGHTPFSSLLAFQSYLIAYLRNKKYIVLSNEDSANEGTVIGTNINHQYSKSYEFESDFQNYVRKFLPIDINYFSLLRPLSEYQIAMLFSKYTEFHSVFRSCNVGSKEKPWKWCCNCSKCLFVYIVLSPFLKKEELIAIFGEDLYDKASLLETFQEILGETGIKPFDCVGSYSEAKYAVSKVIATYEGELPYLLKYYKDTHELDLVSDYEHFYNDDHSVPNQFETILKEELAKYV